MPKYDKTKYDLSQKEKSEYQKTQGKTTAQIIGEMIATGEYKRASPQEQGAMIISALDYAYNEAKKEYFDKKNVEYEGDKWIDKVRDLEKVGIDRGSAILYRKLITAHDGDDNEAEKQRNLINRLPLNAKQKSALDKAFISNWRSYYDEKNVDYSSQESYKLIQMSEAAQGKWAEWETLMTLDQYMTLYPLAYKENKAESLAALKREIAKLAPNWTEGKVSNLAGDFYSSLR